MARRRLPVLLLLFSLYISLSWALQTRVPAKITIQEIQPSPQSRVAQEQAVQAEKHLLEVNENAQKVFQKLDAGKTPALEAEAQKAKEQLADAQTEAQNAAKKVSDTQSGAITGDQWLRAIKELTNYRDKAQSNMQYYTTLSTAILIGGIVLAAATAIASFLRASILAGILSIIVSAMLTVPKLFPISERAEYYRVLFAQSSSLVVQNQLKLHPTIADYNAIARSLQVLSDYEINKFPAGNISDNTQQLIKDLEVNKTPAAEK